MDLKDAIAREVENAKYANHHPVGTAERMLRFIEMQVFNVKDKLPDVECGSFLVFAPKSFPKNSRWLVAEYYADVKGFYSESSEDFLGDVTHWCELPQEPITNA